MRDSEGSQPALKGGWPIHDGLIVMSGVHLVEVISVALSVRVRSRLVWPG
jgi:hypothetical protein